MAEHDKTFVEVFEAKLVREWQEGTILPIHRTATHSGPDAGRREESRRTGLPGGPGQGPPEVIANVGHCLDQLTYRTTQRLTQHREPEFGRVIVGVHEFRWRPECRVTS